MDEMGELPETSYSQQMQFATLGNIPIERFWRSIKYEEVYLKTYDTVSEAKVGIAGYIHWYNYKRRHSGLNRHRPVEVMTNQQQALKWSFKKVGGYVDNCKDSYHTNPQPPLH